MPANRRAETSVAPAAARRRCSGSASPPCTPSTGTTRSCSGCDRRRARPARRRAGDLAGKLVVPQETDVEERDAAAEGSAGRRSRRPRRGGRGGDHPAQAAHRRGGAGRARACSRPRRRRWPRSARTWTASTRLPGAAGVRLVDDKGIPTGAEDIAAGASTRRCPSTAIPSRSAPVCSSCSSTPGTSHLPPARRGWAPEGILAYSKICPHAGCAISLYRYPIYQADERRPGVHLPVPLLDVPARRGRARGLRTRRARAAAAAADGRRRRLPARRRGSSARTSARRGGACTEASREQPRDARTGTACAGADRAIGASGGRCAPPKNASARAAAIKWFTALRLPRPLELPARGDRAVLVHRARGDGDLPDALLRPERHPGRSTTGPTRCCTANRCRRPTARCCTSASASRPGC